MNAPKAGYYRLTQDVQNPKPDRRSKSMMNVPVWMQGWTVKVKYNSYMREIMAERGAMIPDHEPLPFGVIEFADGTQIHFDTEGGEPVFTQGNILLSALEPLAPNLGRFLRDAYATSTQLLGLLLEAGVVTLDQLAKLDQSVQAWTDADTVEFEKHHGV